MKLNENINDYSNSSSFVTYTDYTNSSVNNYRTIYHVISNCKTIDRIPNATTASAISEARANAELPEFIDIDDFFNDLEK